MGQQAHLDSAKAYREGLFSAIICSIWWGIMPIYWQWLRPIESSVIIFYRIMLVAVVCLIAALFKYSVKEILEPLKNRKQVLKYIVAGLLITINWSIYIWAVNADYVIQTCIGYYIEPLMVCIFGVTFFKEKLTIYKKTAFILSSAGVLVVIIYFKEVPIIALSLSVTFSIYAACKKSFNIHPILSLLYETVFLAPIALAAIIYLEATGQGALSSLESGELYKYGVLMLCGLFTAFPLGTFANAANKINLFALGLTEYISPTLSLVIGIFLFNEPFEKIQLVAFTIIWVGLVFFSYGEFENYKLSKETLNEG